MSYTSVPPLAIAEHALHGAWDITLSIMRGTGFEPADLYRTAS